MRNNFAWQEAKERVDSLLIVEVVFIEVMPTDVVSLEMMLTVPELRSVFYEPVQSERLCVRIDPWWSSYKALCAKQS